MAAFTPGNIVVYRVGTGSAALTGVATEVFLDEYTPAGVLVQTIALPTADSGANQTLTASGSATSEGLMTLSVDGRYLLLTGYDAAPGTASVATSASATINRVVGRVGADGIVDTSTAVNTFSGGGIRGVASTDGTDLWLSGSNTGVVKATFGSSTTTVISTTTTNLRAIEIFDGQLYVSSASGTLRLGTVGSGTPTTGPQTITNLPGFPTATLSPHQFYFADLTAAVAGVDTLYISDDRASASGGGITKYSLVGGSWVSNGTAANSLRGLTGDTSGTTVTLYATTSASNANSIVSLIDTGGYNAAFSTTVYTTVATAAANTAFRGVAFAPENIVAPAPGELSIADNAVVEGNAGTTQLVFTVSRANGSAGAVGATWTITFGSADAGDLGPSQVLTGTVSFADGDTSEQIVVDIQGDTFVEGDETFTITLSAPTGGATLGDAAATGTITNDDVTPVPGELSIADNAVVEGDAGTTQLIFTVTRANGDDGAVSASWNISFESGDTADGSDLDGAQLLGGTVSFADGETSQQIIVNIAGDTAVEGDETFTITLSAPTGGATLGDAVATGTITNDDTIVPVPGELSIADANVAEGDSGTATISFTVSRATGDDGAVGATWTATFGTADADDFAPAQVFTGTVSFADGETSKTITLDVQGDLAVEPDETFTVTLSAPTGGATLGDDTATGTIDNDDAIVFFNEFHYDDAGADSGEAIEIAGLAGTDLSGWSIALYNGSDSQLYDSGAIIALSGIIPDQDDGYGTLSFLVPGLQNGAPDAFALVDDSGVVIQFLSYEGTLTADGGPADGMTSTDVGVSEEPAVADGLSLQLVGTGAVYGDFTWAAAMTNTFGAVNTGQDFLGSNATGLVSVADASVAEGDAGTTDLVFIVRRAGGLGSEASVDYVIGLTGTADAADLGPGAVLSGTVTFAVGQSEAEVRVEIQGDTVGEPNETLRIDLSNPIGNIAIVDDASIGTILNDDPVNAEIAEIQGASHTSPLVGQLVTTTGIVTAVDSNGFYIQDPTPDADDATSEGVFVFTSTAPTVAVGDAVTVQGTVAEFQAAPDALTVTEIVSPVVTVNSSGNPLPAATLIGTGGRTPPTEAYDDDGFAVFDPANDGLDFWESMEGMLATIDAPLVVANSNSFGETWIVASEGAGATGLNARDGMTISEGDSNPERIQLDNDANLSPGYTPDHTQGDVLADVTGIVNYAFSAYELLVTAAPTTTTDVTLGLETSALDGDATHVTVASYNVENLDPTDPAAKFDAIAADIVTGMGSPDIIGLQEVQDADGAGNGSDLSGQATADLLIAAIVAAGGPTYQYVEIAPTTPNSTGGEPNGNIRQGFLYNPARVTYVPGSAELVPNAGTRPPLAADFTFNGETITVINAHSTSRGGSDPLMGANQPPNNAGDASRLAQAEAIADYIDSLYLGDPELNIVTLGDFNSFYWEAPLEAIQAGGAQTNLYDLLPEEERYSYQFEGNVQPFDNILVSYNLPTTADLDLVHRNSEQPDSAGRPTDHDQPLARILISADDVITATAGNDVRDSGAGNDTFLLQDGGDDSASGGTGNDYFYYGAEFTNDDATVGGDGVDTLALLGDYQITFDADDLDGIERLVLLSGTSVPGGQADSFYDIEMVDENVGAGQLFAVNATGLQPTESLIFNGLAETDGAFFIRSGGCDDILVGGEGNDSIHGDGGDDALFGRGGLDFLTGGLGEDVLRGGAGEDRFNYETAADSTATDMDWITDFQQIDLIRLVAIDADGNAGNGDTAFTFIGDAAFGNVAGQLRAYESGGFWFVEGDVDGDGNADLMIQVSTVGNAPLTAADFVL